MKICITLIWVGFYGLFLLT